MYERFYQLRERPFALSPDPDYLYPSRVHQEALSYLRYGVEGHAGFVVITGEIGSGKTTLLQTLLRGLDRETTVARLVNTMLEPRELLEAILLDFGVDGSGSKPVLLHRLAEFLVSEREQGRLVLLVVDEAQNLGMDALEEVRMLSNLETEKSKLIQIILVGQPDLRDTLARADMEQLRQRVTVSYHLAPLDADETAAYVNHRLHRAAAGTPLVFPPEVTALVHRRSRGLPRIINVICDAVLLFGYGAERRDIDIALAQEAIAELEETGVLAPERDLERPPAVVRPELRSPQATERTVPTSRAPGHADLPLQATGTDGRGVAVHDRELTLRARESALTRREETLAEQRRVLLEQYRLLKAGDQHDDARMASAAATGAAARGAQPSWPPVARTATPRPAAAPVARAVSHDEETQGFWSRVRRVLGTSSTPVNERS